jgi:N-acetyl-gamma-glutamyl-phosphate reductase
MLPVGIVGASGYSGEVLVKLLLRHPRVRLAAVTSRQHRGKPLSEVIPALRGIGDRLSFVDSDVEQLSAAPIELYFLALPHGAAASFAAPLVAAGKQVIDLSADFRISDPAVYEEFYGQPHPDRELLKRSRFVLPELADDSWKQAALIAAPGCYPTSILTPLAPLLKAGVVSSRGVVVNALSGVSGAGRKVAEEYLYAERAESAKAYGIPKHRHLAEIEEQLSVAAGERVVIQFTPHLAPMRRGIVSTIVAPALKSLEELYQVWQTSFADRPFAKVLPSGLTPDSQYVVGSNRVDFSAAHDPRTGNFVITSAVDNLMKGAGGQAVQIMNLWRGFDETDGLLG